jgi:hypothetical protein
VGFLSDSRVAVQLFKKRFEQKINPRKKGPKQHKARRQNKKKEEASERTSKAENTVQLCAKSCWLELELELELIQTRMIQKPLLWVEVGKSADVLVGICELRLSPPARYDPQCPSLLDFLSGFLAGGRS